MHVPMRRALAILTLYGAIALMAVIVLVLFLRNLLAVGTHISLDPNEGWNAIHAAHAMGTSPLYDSAKSLMVNNYPPLSFYAVGVVGKLLGDFVLGGRIVSLGGFTAICIEIALALRAMGSRTKAGIFGALFFAGVTLVTSNYVGINDPQLLAHAVQLLGLVLLLRGNLAMAALLFTGALFIKHNLLALPLAASLWLMGKDSRASVRLMLACLGWGLAGLVGFRIIYGSSLVSVVASPRLYLFSNFKSAVKALLCWSLIPMLCLFALKRHPYSAFCFAYCLCGLVLGLVFSPGDGVDANIFFDLAIGLSLSLGLLADQDRFAPACACCMIELVVLLWLNFADNNFFFTPDFAAQSARDIAFLKARKGDAMCQDLSLCLWAGKRAEVDVFNLAEFIKTKNRTPQELIGALEAHRFAMLQLQDIDVFGPEVRAVIQRYYRLDHTDDNGMFFLAAPLEPAPHG